MQNVVRRSSDVLIEGICRHRGAVLVLLAYALLSVVMTWPLAARLGASIPAGSGNDVWVHWWTYWWVKKCITEGHNPFYTDLMFHPHGVSLITHNIAWLNIALWLPLQAIVGSAAAYSLIYITAFALNGFAMYLLVREWTGSQSGACIGGLVYGFWPYVLSKSGQPNFIIVCWVPLALLYLRRTLEGRLKRDAVLAGIFIALTGVTRWHLLIMGGVVIGLYLLYTCLTNMACRTRRTLELLVLVGLVAAALTAPLATPIIVAQLTRAHPDDVFIDEQDHRQADLLAYVLPNSNLRLWGDVVFRLRENLRFTTDRVLFVGYATIVLALYGAVKNWRLARFWVLTAVMYIALALGPQLQVGNQLYPQVPMPYRLVEDLFFVRILREPHRFNIFLGLPVGMLAALGVVALLRQRLLERKPALLVGIVGALILGEYCIVPYPTTRVVTPTWYHQLAQEPAHFAVLDLPMQHGYFDKQYMFYQTTHGKALVGGHVSRLPREAFVFLQSTPFLEGLHQANVMDSALSDVTHQLRSLSEKNVRYIILHKQFAGSERLAAWRDWLTFEPYHEDADLVVYRTDPHLGRDFALAYEMTNEVGLIRAAFVPDEVLQTGSIRVDARWGSGGKVGRDYDVCLRLVNTLGEAAQWDCQSLCSTWPTSRWDANEVVRGDYTLYIDPFLEAGTYTLALALAEDATSTDTGTALAVGELEVKALPRVFVEPSPAFPLHARWGDVISLLGFDIQDSANLLQLTLYWQAEQRMDISYKVFVHLIDPATEAIVVQNDAVPRQWTYPTTWWERDEVVADTIALPLDEVSPGQYRLQVGLYDPETGERLPAYSAGGARYPNDTVPLTVINAEGMGRE